MDSGEGGRPLFRRKAASGELCKKKGPVPSSLSILEIGLCAVIVGAPLAFGAVGAGGRLALELTAFALTAVWIFAGVRYEIALPPRPVIVAIGGLLGIAALQLAPIGGSAVSLISPGAAVLRRGLDPVPDATLSLAPDATASALRTGAALAGLLFVATSVVAARGARRLALAALISAAFQGLYGLLVLASGHDRIWSVPKTAYLESATGTFVNRNHFAAFLAASLPLGVGLVVATARGAQARSREARGLALALGPDGTKALLMTLALLTGLAGLLLSFSRAGTALGLAAVAGTAAGALRGKPLQRAAAIAIVLAIAAVPLLDLGADRLVSRYAAARRDLAHDGGRWAVALDTARMIGTFPAAGCGFGAFTWAYPAFSSPGVRLHYTHAHDDLLQLGAEGGLLALVLLGFILVSVARVVRLGLRDGADPLATGAAFGLAALLVHSLVDFNFHIPADAALGALLAGVLFGASWNGRS